MRWIQAPANGRILQPIFQGLDVGLGHLKLGAHGRHFKQAEPFRQSDARLRQIQQELQGLNQGHLPGRGVCH